MIDQIHARVMLVSVLASGLLTLPIDAMAYCNQQRCVEKITRIYTAAHVNKVFITTSGDETKLGCAPIEGKYIQLTPNQTMFKEMYATVLAGLLSQREMTLKVYTDGGPCRLEYTTIDYNYQW